MGQVKTSSRVTKTASATKKPPRRRTAQRKASPQIDEQRDFDVLVIGAGISGVSAAYHLQKMCPNKSFSILEGRPRLGGTWDLFRYPGIRSDSDMYTLGYSFRPWTDPKAIADGPSILKYVEETAREFGIYDKIRFNRYVTEADWSSAQSRWTLRVTDQTSGEEQVYTANFVAMCTGYYDYAQGYQPDFPKQSSFKGKIVHPQFWPEMLNYDDKNVVIVGSGATAVTLVPEMAKRAKRVTMLQRSPTYIVAMPAVSRLAQTLHRYLPDMAAYRLVRTWKILMQRLSFWYCRRFPDRAKKMLVQAVRDVLGNGYDVEKHFTPHYNPWDQRVCLAPDGDFFVAMKKGKADVVTGHIDRFDAKGITLASGEHLDADIIVSATGLKLQMLGGLKMTVDGKAIHPHDTYNYKGMMFSGIPNMSQSFGYTNASWTLKCDLTSAYLCRLLNHMDKSGYTIAEPVVDETRIEEEPLLDFSSGYVQRAAKDLPRQGHERPWKMYQNYVLDLVTLGYGPVDDPAMQFSSARN